MSLIIKLIEEHNLGLLCIIETWLKMKDKAKLQEFREFKLEILSQLIKKQRCGVAAMFQRDLPIESIKTCKTNYL